ncbi:hypothetical protein, partial [Enterovibrio coralii]|uniref:hypothetical protein n=1 Tax=Enterovibrio coralii TaxID=294935 RepID=UPI001E5AF161
RCFRNPQNTLLTCLDGSFSVEAGGHFTDSFKRVKRLFSFSFEGLFAVPIQWAFPCWKPLSVSVKRHYR